MNGHPRTFGLDCRAASEERGGRGTVVREQIRGLMARRDDNRYLLYARESWDGVEIDERFAWVILPAPDPVWHIRAADHANRHCHAYLSTNSYLTAWFLRIPSVLVVMDMVTFDPALAPRSRSVWIERATLPYALRRTSSILCISAATERDLHARFPRTKKRTSVTLLAASPAFRDVSDPDAARARERHGLDSPYVLSVGTLEPRKNLPRLIEAFAALSEDERRGTQLVLVGARGWESDTLDTLISRNKGVVRVLGFVDEGDLPGIYRGATLFAYPSLYEGFGLPVLEAMNARTPVLTSSVSSLPEVGGDAVLYAEPRDTASIRTGLATGLRDDALRGALVKRAYERAGAFSWQRHVSDVVAALADASI